MDWLVVGVLGCLLFDFDRRRPFLVVLDDIRQLVGEVVVALPDTCLFDVVVVV